MPSDSIQDLFADKGNIRGTGTVVEQPKAAGDRGRFTMSSR